jgi:hypothetical protein
MTLLAFVGAWLRVDLLILDVHGGTSEEDVMKIFKRADDVINSGKSRVYVFLDEINTCAHMFVSSSPFCLYCYCCCCDGGCSNHSTFMTFSFSGFSGFYFSV